MESLLSFDEINRNNIHVFKKKIKKEISNNIVSNKIYVRVCLISSENPDAYHKYCGINKFTRATYDLKKYTESGQWYEPMVKYQARLNCACESIKQVIQNKINQINEIIDTSHCQRYKLFDTNKILNFTAIYKRNEKFTLYRTIYRFSTAFYVAVNFDDNIVDIYGRTDDVVPFDVNQSTNYNRDSYFNKLIARYNPVEIFIGKSDYNAATKKSNAYGSMFDGNSILLRLPSVSDIYHYVCISDNIREFTTDEQIISYSSNINTRGLSKPMAVTTNENFKIDDGINKISTISKIECRHNVRYETKSKYMVKITCFSGDEIKNIVRVIYTRSELLDMFDKN